MKYLKTFNNDSEYVVDQPNFSHPHVSFIKSPRQVIYEKTAPAHDYSKDYLTLEALSNGRIYFQSDGNDINDLQLSMDSGNTWEYYSDTAGYILVESGDKVMLKGGLTATTSDNGCVNISTTCQFNAMGNPLSLCYSNFGNVTSITQQRIFMSLFSGCTRLVSAENLSLPATALTRSCYSSMFAGCSGLTTAPELPAMTLATYCYTSMFFRCTSLTTAPELPATALAENCYNNMFSGCTSLTTAPELPAITLAENCYKLMFNSCTSLTTAPELPATTLVNGCYSGMFQGCTNLNYIKAMFTTTPGINYTQSWVDGVAATGTFVKNSAATWSKSGTSGIPTGWTVQTAS